MTNSISLNKDSGNVLMPAIGITITSVITLLAIAVLAACAHFGYISWPMVGLGGGGIAIIGTGFVVGLIEFIKEKRQAQQDKVRLDSEVLARLNQSKFTGQATDPHENLNLNQEVKNQIISHLDEKSLSRLMRTCKSWHQFVRGHKAFPFLMTYKLLKQNEMHIVGLDRKVCMIEEISSKRVLVIDLIHNVFSRSIESMGREERVNYLYSEKQERLVRFHPDSNMINVIPFDVGASINACILSKDKDIVLSIDSKSGLGFILATKNHENYRIKILGSSTWTDLKLPEKANVSAFVVSGRRVFIGSEKGKIFAFDLPTGKQTAEIGIFADFKDRICEMRMGKYKVIVFCESGLVQEVHLTMESENLHLGRSERQIEGRSRILTEDREFLYGYIETLDREVVQKVWRK